MRTILIGFIEVLLNIYHAFFVKRLSAKKQIDKWINELDGRKKDKVAIITGGTSGIGKEIAYSLAKAQYKVIIAARNEELARNVVQDMKIVTKNQNVSFIKVDFSSLESVKKFTTEFVAMKVPLDLLINNAGVYNSKYIATSDGFESQFGINHLSHFLLTNELIPCLNKASSVIINLSSCAHYGAKRINYETVTLNKGFQVNGHYAQSKLANVLFTLSLHDRLKGKNVSVYAAHPGGIRTQIYRGDPLMDRAINQIVPKVLPWAMLEPIDGSLTPLFLAFFHPEQGRGKYFADLREQPMNPYATIEAADELWKKSCEFIGKKV